MTSKRVPRKATAGRAKPGTSREAAAARRKTFIEAYIANGGNGTQAAIAAGFSAKTADVTASKLLADPKMAAEVRSRIEDVAAITGLSTERTLREVARLAYADPRKLLTAGGQLKPIHELDDDTAATIASVEWDEMKAEGVVVGLTRKVKQWDKNAALEKAMKFHGLYEKDNSQQGQAGKSFVEAMLNARKRVAAR